MSSTRNEPCRLPSCPRVRQARRGRSQTAAKAALSAVDRRVSQAIGFASQIRAGPENDARHEDRAGGAAILRPAAIGRTPTRLPRSGGRVFAEFQSFDLRTFSKPPPCPAPYLPSIRGSYRDLWLYDVVNRTAYVGQTTTRKQPKHIRVPRGMKVPRRLLLSARPVWTPRSSKPIGTASCTWPPR
jgi:hypothetical protein